MRAATISRTTRQWPGAWRASGPTKPRSISRSGAASTRVRDWIDNGRALLNRAQARFEQAADRIGERLGLGRSLREELRERQQGQQAPTAGERPQERQEKAPEPQSPAGIEAAPAGAGAASEGMTPAARWKAAIEAEAKEVQAKALRIAAKAEKRRAGLAKKLDEIERAGQPSQAVFPPYFLAPKRAMKEQLADGRKSGTGWCKR